MPIDSRWFAAPAVLALLTFIPAGAGAESFGRIRSESELLTKAFTTAYQRSPTFRSIVERIEASDVIVHLTCGHFKSVRIAGQTQFVVAGPAARYLRVQILCEQQPPSLVAIVAHELQHVLEIASTPSVVDDRSFARLFTSIGFSNCLSRQSDQFETPAAVAAGERVRAELLHSSASVALAH